ncbi:MAG: EAL domain-containing protein [Novosphingobium sp.]
MPLSTGCSWPDQDRLLLCRIGHGQSTCRRKQPDMGARTYGALKRATLKVTEVAAGLWPSYSNGEEVRAEQFSALARMVPLLYFILIINAWGLGGTFLGLAPPWLTVYTPLILTLFCGVRLTQWWSKRRLRPSDAQVRKEMRRTEIVAVGLSSAICLWSFAISSYGDDYDKAYVPFFMAVAMLTTMLCLIHLRTAAVIVAVVVGLGFVGYFSMSSARSLVTAAAVFLPVTFAFIVIILIQNRDFARTVDARNQILRLADYDTLTDLPNRRAFTDELARHLDLPDNRGALLFVDLDGFKLVNDTRGHGVGDDLLIAVADRLKAACNVPGIMAARLGGDEFAVLLPRKTAAQAQARADHIIKALSAPYSLVHGNIEIGASIGIALAPDHGDNNQALLSHADIALYEAKAAGKGHARMFVSDMEDRLHERVHMETELRAALRDRDGLFVFYQPVVSIETGEVTAREALIRWHHPARGWVSPAEFVPIAEQCGLADGLGAFVLETACHEAAGWEDRARVAVNISAAQLGKGTLPEYILSVLVTSGLSPNRLEIEVTETALLDDEHDVVGDLRRIRALGVRVALDDFGTGFSSLSHLRAFPFDKIKIDGSFVKDAVDRPDCAAVVRVVADLGKRLGVTTVAEAVETQEQLDCIRSEGCTEVQGYLMGRPSPSSSDAPLIDCINRGEADQAAA